MGIGERIAAIRARMAQVCVRAGRELDEVTLLAVSKTVPADQVAQAWLAGQRDFGESRQQEGADKVAALPSGPRWHFIGTLQRNKVRKVLADFSVIHSIDSLKLARHVDRIAGELGVKPHVFLEVNIAGEASKGGFSPAALREEIQGLAELPNLEIRGLMVIPPEQEDPEMARAWFARARELRGELEQVAGRKWPELSMGMSGDFEVAIEEGSTIVRVGSAIFGERSYP